MPDFNQALPKGTILRDQYVVQQCDSRIDNFGFRYLGRCRKTEQYVWITEYFPTRLAERGSDGKTAKVTGATADSFKAALEYFRSETDRLAEIRDEHLLTVRERVEQNGTSYRITDREKGTTLQTALERGRKTISEKAAKTIFLPILQVLQKLHDRDIIHGGVSPAAVLLTADRRALLTNLRGAEIRLAREEGRLEDIPHGPTVAPEQYRAGGNQGPWTDVYSVAASIYRVVTGENLPAATDRDFNDTVENKLAQSDGLSDGVKRVLVKALQLKEEERFQSADELATQLVNPEPVQPEPPTEEEPEAHPDEQPPSRGTVEPDEPVAPEQVLKDATTDEAETSTQKPSSMTRHLREALGTSLNVVEKKLWRKNRLVRAGTGVLVVLFALTSSMFVFGDGWQSSEHSAQSQYASWLAEADSLFQVGEFGDAAQRYRDVQANFADSQVDDYVSERIAEANERAHEQRSQAYDRLMTHADALRAEAEVMSEAGDANAALDALSQAHEAYLDAWEMQPEDSLAYDEAQAVYAELSQMATLADDESEPAEQPETAETEPAEDEPSGAEQFRAEQYERHMSAGEDHLENEAYEDAQRRYRMALDYRPDSDAAQERLALVDSLLNESSRESEFLRYLERGDDLVDEGHLASARREYELALEISPDDELVQERIQLLDEELNRQAEQQSRYQYHRAQGDLRYDEGQWDEALVSYQRALEARQGDVYVEQRVEEVRQRIQEEQAAREAEDRMRRDDGVYTMVDQEPSVVGGLEALHEEVEYPRRAINRGIEGRVVIQMVVQADGSVREAEVIRGIGGGCDEEALRVVREARFEPALVDGEPVDAIHTTWVRFRLDGDE